MNAVFAPAESGTVSVIVPVYNELPTIETATRAVFAARLPAGVAMEVVIVDDGSTDGTADVLARLASELPFKLVRHAQNRGKGAALRTGIGAASGHYLLFQDSDLEYSPQDYGSLLAPLVAGNADIVYGTRFGGGAQNPGVPGVSRLANGVLTAVSNGITGLRVTDMETGYKAFSRQALAGIRIEENGFGVEPELTAKLAPAVLAGRLRLKEIAISYRPRRRREGKKIRFRDGLWAMLCIVRYGFAARRQA